MSDKITPNIKSLLESNICFNGGPAVLVVYDMSKWAYIPAAIKLVALKDNFDRSFAVFVTPEGVPLPPAEPGV